LEKYHVTLIAPPNYIHSLAFREIALLLIYSFKSLGVDCTYKTNELDKNRINIVLGYHLAEPEQLHGFKYIPYQLEQLSEKEGWFDSNVLRVLKNAYMVWDYSAENISFLKQQGIPAKLLPVGYHESLNVMKHDSPKDIDVLFYGCMNDRRRRILEELIALGYKVEYLFGVYGQKRDAYIARAKIVLNIHFYESQILEVVRLAYLINNKVFVLSETSCSNLLSGVTLVTADYEELVGSVRKYLGNEALLEETRLRTFQDFKDKYSMAIFLKNLI
jgi:hypothetical protein